MDYKTYFEISSEIRKIRLKILHFRLVNQEDCKKIASHKLNICNNVLAEKN